MPKQWVFYILYAVRLQGKPGWQSRYITSERTNIKDIITKEHLDAIEYRIIHQGKCTRSRFTDYTRGIPGSWELLDFGWYYDVSEDCWYAPEESGNRACCSSVPAFFDLRSEPPRSGWWILYFIFSPRGEENALWEKQYPSQKDILCTVSCSDVFDPIDDFKKFIQNIKEGKASRILINEEGSYVHLLAWNNNHDLFQIRIESIFYDEEYSYDFFVKKKNFLLKLENCLQNFIYFGGWKIKSSSR